jgi:hypothetical protein
VLCVERGRRELTNAAFLMGAFMLLVLGDDPARMWHEVRTGPYVCPQYRMNNHAMYRVYNMYKINS